MQVLDQQHMLVHSSAASATLGPTELLPKKWITEQWNAGFFITALAGADLIIIIMGTCAAPYIA